MSKNKKSLQDLTLLDRFLFAEVMEDPKTFENILSIILGEDISPELKELLYYMEHTTEEISCSTSRLQEIKNHVNIVKSSEEIGVKYMQEWEEKILEKRKARAEGLAEGRAEGQTITLIQQMKKKIQKSKPLIQIADELEEEPDSIQSLYECISQNVNLTTEEIYKIYISTNKTED